MSRRKCEFSDDKIRAAVRKMKALAGSPDLHRAHDAPLIVVITAAESYLPAPKPKASKRARDAA